MSSCVVGVYCPVRECTALPGGVLPHQGVVISADKHQVLLVRSFLEAGQRKAGSEGGKDSGRQRGTEEGADRGRREQAAGRNSACDAKARPADNRNRQLLDALGPLTCAIACAS